MMLVQTNHRRCAVALLCVVMIGTTTALTRADDGNALAIVNGKPIDRSRVVSLLMDSHGVEILQQIVLLDLARQEAARKKVRVTPADVEAEFENAVDKIATEAGLTGDDGTRANKLQALDLLLKEKRISMAEFRLAMERNAYLRKAVSDEVQITDETLREEFARTYGEKVVVRHIQLTARDARKLQDALQALATGEDFAAVARRLSENPETASRGGEMAPFAFNDASIPAALRQAAFELQPGEISHPVAAGNFRHILKLERRIPPDNVRFEDVRPQVLESVRDRATRRAMEQLMTRLFAEANVRVTDTSLREAYQKFLKESEAQGATP